LLPSTAGTAENVRAVPSTGQPLLSGETHPINPGKVTVQMLTTEKQWIVGAVPLFSSGLSGFKFVDIVKK